MRAFEITWDKTSGTLAIAGAFGVHQASAAIAEFEAITQSGTAITAVDITKVSALDTVGAMLLREWAGNVPITCADDEQRGLLSMVGKLDLTVPPQKEPLPPLTAQMIALGKWASNMAVETRHMLTFTGKSLVMVARALRHPQHLRIPMIAQNIEQLGIQALPIIGLIAFLISIVLAYQGVEQLRPYGAQQFTVDLVALSILREMGVLLTAIMVAGRSGSAFTAEIGVMKAREEVDALQVMGLDPFDILVVPRLIAIIIALPLLTFFANMMGLLGGFIISHSLIDITFSQYLERVHFAADGNDLFVGMFKAPVFAFFIGVVGCMHGLRVSGSAESIGRETTVSVVKAIFLVLVLDAFFSILFQKLGI